MDDRAGERAGQASHETDSRDHGLAEGVHGRDLLGEHALAPKHWLSQRGLDVEAEVHDVELIVGSESR